MKEEDYWLLKEWQPVCNRNYMYTDIRENLVLEAELGPGPKESPRRQNG